MKRFTIAMMMGMVLACAVIVAALRSASDAWAAVILALTLLALGASALGAIEARGARRSFWRGFAIFGGCYLALMFSPWSGENLNPKLPTAQLLAYIHDEVQAAQPRATNLNAPISRYEIAYQVQTLLGPGATVADDATAPSALSLALSQLFAGAVNEEPFRRIGHCLFTLSIGLLGGVIARRFHRTNPVATHDSPITR